MKRFLAVAGLTGFVLAVFIGTMLIHGHIGAKRLDVTTGGAFSADPCYYPLQDASLERRTMSLKESQILKVILASNSMTECQTTVRVQAPNFESGDAYWMRTVTLPPMAKEIELLWVLVPKDLGTHKIFVSVENVALSNIQLGVTVTNILGLDAFWLQIAVIVGLVLGPLLSIPWWLDRFSFKRKPT